MTILNVGLSNNPYDVADIIHILNQVFNDVPILFNIDDGIYNGAIEPTLAIVYDDNIDETDVALIAVYFTQQCIASKINGEGKLIYNPNHKGEQHIFDESLFITPKYNGDEEN